MTVATPSAAARHPRGADRSLPRRAPDRPQALAPHHRRLLPRSRATTRALRRAPRPERVDRGHRDVRRRHSSASLRARGCPPPRSRAGARRCAAFMRIERRTAAGGLDPRGRRRRRRAGSAGCRTPCPIDETSSVCLAAARRGGAARASRPRPVRAGLRQRACASRSWVDVDRDRLDLRGTAACRWPAREQASGGAVRSRRPAGALEAWLERGRPQLCARSRHDAVFVNARGGPLGRIRVLEDPAGPTREPPVLRVARSSARASSLVRHPSAAGRSRPAGGTGAAGPCVGDDHGHLHPSRPGATSGKCIARFILARDDGQPKESRMIAQESLVRGGCRPRTRSASRSARGIHRAAQSPDRSG